MKHINIDQSEQYDIWMAQYTVVYGTATMGTTVHAHVPKTEDLTQQFFFDEKYLLDCHQTTSKTTKETLPGSCYFNFLSTKENAIYRGTTMYWRAWELMNSFAAHIQSPEYLLLYQTWLMWMKKATGITTPWISCLKTMLMSPIVQSVISVQWCSWTITYHHLGSQMCTPDKESGHLCAVDRNRTWQKITKSLPSFVKKFVGQDLADTTVKMAEDNYIRVLKKSSKKLERLNIKLSQKNLTAIQTGLLKIKIKRKWIRWVQYNNIFLLY